MLKADQILQPDEVLRNGGAISRERGTGATRRYRRGWDPAWISTP